MSSAGLLNNTRQKPFMVCKIKSATIHTPTPQREGKLLYLLDGKCGIHFEKPPAMYMGAYLITSLTTLSCCSQVGVERVMSTNLTTRSRVDAV